MAKPGFAVAVLCVLAAGCAGPGGVGRDVPTEPHRETNYEPHYEPPVVEERPVELPPLLVSDNMTLQYEEGASTLRMRLRAAPVMDAFGHTSQGHVASVVSSEGWRWHFGLGPCLTPIWMQRDAGAIRFLVAGDGFDFVFLPGFLLLRDAPLGRCRRNPGCWTECPSSPSKAQNSSWRQAKAAPASSPGGCRTTVHHMVRP